MNVVKKLKKCYTIDEKNANELKNVAILTGVSISSLINQFIENGLKELQKVNYNYSEFKK